MAAGRSDHRRDPRQLAAVTLLPEHAQPDAGHLRLHGNGPDDAAHGLHHHHRQHRPVRGFHHGHVRFAARPACTFRASTSGWRPPRRCCWAVLGGALNGFLVARVKLPALVVTLGTFAFYRGMAFALLGDQAARGYPEAFTFLGQGTSGRTAFSLLGRALHLFCHHFWPGAAQDHLRPLSVRHRQQRRGRPLFRCAGRPHQNDHLHALRAYVGTGRHRHGRPLWQHPPGRRHRPGTVGDHRHRAWAASTFLAAAAP